MLNRRADAKTHCPGIREYFSDHFNHSAGRPAPSSITTDIPRHIRDLGEIPYDRSKVHGAPPTLGELKSCIAKLRSNKASTDVPAEYLKVAIKNPEFGEILVDIFDDIWTSKKYPMTSAPTAW